MGTFGIFQRCLQASIESLLERKAGSLAESSLPMPEAPLLQKQLPETDVSSRSPEAGEQAPLLATRSFSSGICQVAFSVPVLELGGFMGQKIK